MLVSVVTTCYNSANYIERTILAVLNQKLVDCDIEYIISDDGSTDDTISVIKTIIDTHEKGSRIQLIEHPKNIGVVQNFFRAIDACQGDYIAFCDSDDIWVDCCKLSKQLKFMESSIECVLTYHRLVDIEFNEVPSNYYSLSNHNPVLTTHTSTLMIRSNALEIPWTLLPKMTRMNDQLLKFLLRNKGFFRPLLHIEPNIRVIRSESVFASPRSQIDRAKSSLFNWTRIYEHYKNSEHEDYLAQKVQGFASIMKWLKYEEHKEVQFFWDAIYYDFRTGVFFRRLQANLKSFLFKPLVYVKWRFLEKQQLRK